MVDEFTQVVKRITKTKENKKNLATLSKYMKEHSGSSLHQTYRNNIIKKLEFWIENINRDKGIIKPYFFVILAIYSLAVNEVSFYFFSFHSLV